MSNPIKELRMKLTPNEIKKILGSFGIIPFDENETEIIFPTVCHNLTGGSPKLYYYLDEKIFKCYTQCNSMFDIFDLIIKIKKLRGEENFNLSDAINYTGLEQNKNISKETIQEIEYLRKLNNGSKLAQIQKEEELRIIDTNILKRYPYNEYGVSSWLEEGITKSAMNKFNIGYDPIKNVITIPNFDKEGNLIGIRGRFLNPDSIAKYMPIKYNQIILSHPTGKILYGYFENKSIIQKKGIAIIFEGEKSVLKMESYYPGNNIAVATTGKKITLHHLNDLLSLNIKEVVLAYDKDYTNKKEMKEKLEEYIKITDILISYFDVSIIIDDENKLGYKDSPIDKGKEIFEYLMKNRMKR